MILKLDEKAPGLGRENLALRTFIFLLFFGAFFLLSFDLDSESNFSDPIRILNVALLFINLRGLI